MKTKYTSMNKDISSILNKLNTTVLVISLFLLTAASLLFIYVSAVNIMTKTLGQEAKTGAKRIEWVVKSYKNIAQGIGSIPELSNPHISTTAKELILANKANEYKLSHCGIIRTDGYSDMDEFYRGDREYFHEALKGNVCINDPVVSKSINKLTLIIGAPIWRNGIYNGRIDSVLYCLFDINILNSILREFNISKHCNMYIIGTDGTTVASLDEQQVLSGYSNIKAAETNKNLRKIAEFEKKTLEGTKTKSHIIINGNLHCYTSWNIPGTPGWALIIDAPVWDFLSTFWISLAFTLSISVAIIIVSRQLIKKHSKLISEPVKEMAERLRQAAVGDFKTDVNLEDPIEEIKIIANATHSLIYRMDQVLNGISSDFATSNLRSFVNYEDYYPIIDSFEKKLNLHLCFFDNKMDKLLGSFDDKTEKKFQAPMMINGKSCGKYIIQPAEGCTISDEYLQIIADTLAALIGRVLENIISREIHHKARQKNEYVNNEKILQASEDMAKKLLSWTKDIKDIDNTTGNGSLKKTCEAFEKEAQEFSVSVHENAEFSRFTNFDYTLKEEDYSVSYLLEDVEIRTSRNAINKENITVSATEKPEEILFGDRPAIERIITRIILFLESKNPNCSINTISSVIKKKFGYTLQFKFIVENHKFTEQDLKLLSSIEKPGKKSNTKLLAEDIKLLSAYNHLWLMNGTVKTLSVDDANYKLLVEIPQL